MTRNSLVAIRSFGDCFGISREHLEVVFLNEHVGAVSAPTNFAAVKAMAKGGGYWLAGYGVPDFPAEATSFRHVEELFWSTGERYIAGVVFYVKEREKGVVSVVCVC